MELIQMFKNQKESDEARREAKEFGDQVYELVCLIGQGNKVFRFLVV